MKLVFYGGVDGLVTGANYLLDTGNFKFLVDCGLAQGSKYADSLNYEKFPYDPAEINYVFITHSHVDHMGRLPKLYKDGFRGKVYATTATRDLIIASLPDTQHRIAEDAKEHQIAPLYDEDDMVGVEELIQGVEYGKALELGGITVMFHDAGHILGSSIIEFRFSGEGGKLKKIFFSGDLGNPPTPLLRTTEFVEDADYVVIESAYGDRIHEDRSKRKEKLTSIIIDTIKQGGVLMIPSFALERTQELLFELNGLINEKVIKQVPVFVDSPLAIKLTKVYEKHPEYFNERSNYLIDSGDEIFRFPTLKFTTTVNESKAINNIHPPKIIIAGAGMSNGGRILHHEMRYLSDPKSTILFVGYQVAGSLGRRVLDGAKEVSIFGQKIPVRCRVEAIGGYSAHADQAGLLKWIKTANTGRVLKKVFVVQGESKAAATLADKIKADLEVEAVVPASGEVFEL